MPIMKPIYLAVAATLISGCGLNTTTTFNQPYASEAQQQQRQVAQQAYDNALAQEQSRQQIPPSSEPMLTIQPIGTGTPAQLMNVLDSHTLLLNIPSWPQPFAHALPVRLAGAELPRANGQCQAEIDAARATESYLNTALAQGQLMINMPVREADFAIKATVTLNSINVVDLLKQQQLAKNSGDRWCH